MALSWNEIKSRAITFSKEWESEERENAESQSFWNEFFKESVKNHYNLTYYNLDGLIFLYNYIKITKKGKL